MKNVWFYCIKAILLGERRSSMDEIKKKKGLMAFATSPLGFSCFRLFNLPDVVGLEKFGEVMVLLLFGDLVKLRPNGVVVGWSLDVANYA